MTPVEEIKERLNIIDVIQEYVPLKNMGSNHKGLCPFHNEKSPSFTASEHKQFFHCFGCGKGGDIFTFVQEFEGVEFPEALRMLAAKANVELKAHNPKESNEKTRLLDCLALAAEFFHAALLKSEEGKVARDYIAKRGLSDEVVKQFKLGYSADSWDTLMNFLKKKGYSEKEIEKAGLIVPSTKGRAGFYDRFRGRLMFPIENAHGNVIGFTARTLKADEAGAKYINTPQTAVYNKSQAIYGLSHSRKHIKNVNAIVIVEGNVDVITAHQFKFRNVIATSGTALTIEQVRLLKRYSPNIILAFDADSAGIKAAWKGMKIAIQQGMNIKVMRLPEGKDPDDLIREDAQQFRKLGAEAKLFMDYAFDAVLNERDLGNVQHKKQAAAELLPMIALVPDSIEQSHYLDQLGQRLQVDADLLRQRIQESERNNRVANRQSDQNQQPEQQPAQQTPQQVGKLEQLGERVCAVLTVQPAEFQTAIEHVNSGMFPEGEVQTLYKMFETSYNHHGIFDIALVEQENQTNAGGLQKAQMIGEELYSDYTTQAIQMELLSLLSQIEREHIQTRLKAVEHQLSEAERIEDEEAIRRLSEEVRHLTQSLNNVS